MIVNEENIKRWFAAPKFHDFISRPKFLLELCEKVEKIPVVAVEGLSGSGKSYLVASYIQTVSFENEYQNVLWYDPESNDTLDNFFAQIDSTIKLDGASTISKSKELLQILNTRKILLIIDNYEKVDVGSYSNLISMAMRFEAPASIILISQMYIETSSIPASIGRLEIRGFDDTIMNQYLSKLGLVDIESSIIQQLVSKTG